MLCEIVVYDDPKAYCDGVFKMAKDLWNARWAPGIRGRIFVSSQKRLLMYIFSMQEWNNNNEVFVCKEFQLHHSYIYWKADTIRIRRTTTPSRSGNLHIITPPPIDWSRDCMMFFRVNHTSWPDACADAPLRLDLKHCRTFYWRLTWRNCV